jgi:hypothetical protein
MASFYVCFSILHEISHWKMYHFGKYQNAGISPLKFKGIGMKEPDSGEYFESCLFGGCLRFDNGQFFFTTDGQKITQQNKYANFDALEHFFGKDWLVKKDKDFKLKGCARPESKRWKEAHEGPGNDHRPGVHKYYV